MEILDLRYPACPIRNIFSRFSDKWSLLILYSLYGQEQMRYKDLRNAIPDISQKMLTSTLKSLEKNNLINRKAYAEIPPRVEYSLTETGRSFMPVFEQMLSWAQEHFEKVTNVSECQTKIT